MKGSVVGNRRPINSHARKPSTALFLEYVDEALAPIRSSRIVDLDIENPFARGCSAENESTLYDQAGRARMPFTCFSKSKVPLLKAATSSGFSK